MEIKDSNEAFDHAIKHGILSDNLRSPQYAGDYMYMYTDKRGDHFKHFMTRRYTTCPSS